MTVKEIFFEEYLYIRAAILAAKIKLGAVNRHFAHFLMLKNRIGLPQGFSSTLLIKYIRVENTFVFQMFKE